MRLHYLEVVTRDVTSTCALFTRLHGWSFGPPMADLGGSMVTDTSTGTRVGVRAPLAPHEHPIVRPYFEVGDIAEAVRQAEAAGARIAYAPTRQGDTGTWAICIVGDAQVGFWQR